MAERLRERVGTESALKGLPAWSAVDGREALVRRLRFADFSAAFGFMTRVAMVAEAMDHHPEWSNVYNRVEIVLATHSVGGVTALDVAMAQAVDRLAAACGGE